MGKMMFKNRPGGYITIPIVVTKCQKLTLGDKAVLCYFMGYWMNGEDKAFYLSYTATNLGMTKEEVKTSMKNLETLGLINVIGKRNTYYGDVTFSVTVNASNVNSLVGVELIATNEPAGKVVPVEQPVQKKRAPADPLAWMDMDYYKKDREGCQR